MSKSVNIEQILENREELPKFLKTNYPELWMELAWKKVNTWRSGIRDQNVLLGDTADFSRELFTLDPRASEMVNFAFSKYWQDDLIYKGAYLVNWSIGLQTAVSDVFGEIEYEKRIDPFVTFEYEALEWKEGKYLQHIPDGISGQSYESNANWEKGLHPKLVEFTKNYLKPPKEWKRLQLSTVRPETKFTDLAVAMHPDKFDIYFNEDIFYKEKTGYNKELACKFLDLILSYNIEVFYHLPALKSDKLKLIFTDKVDASFGTGIVKITPGHDLFDYNLYNEFVENGILKGEKIQTCIGRDGRLLPVCNEFAGLTIDEARPRIIKKLIETGFVPKKSEAELQHLESENETKEVLTDEEFGKLQPEKQNAYLANLYPEYQVNWNYEHNVSVCERTKTVIEPLISEEFFISFDREFEREVNNSTHLELENEDKNNSPYLNIANEYVSNSPYLGGGGRSPTGVLFSPRSDEAGADDFLLQNNNTTSFQGEEKINTSKKFEINPNLIKHAKKMSKEMTLAEKIFWFNLLESKKAGYKFAKQEILLNYIVDFYCSKLLLAIEIDGIDHEHKVDYDRLRTDLLDKMGIKVIRYTNQDVLENLEDLKIDLEKQILLREKELLLEAKSTPVAPSGRHPLDRGDLDPFLYGDNFKDIYNTTEILEFGEPRENEVFRSGSMAVVYDPNTDLYAGWRDVSKNKIGLAGGGDDGKSLRQTAIDETAEELGLVDISEVYELGAEMKIHYYHAGKKLNRVASCKPFLIILSSTQSNGQKLESHEQNLELVWDTGENIYNKLLADSDQIATREHYAEGMRRGIAKVTDLKIEKLEKILEKIS